ncbi:MAG: sialidase family protein, partial [Schleiferiaceae bacterium]
KITTFLGTIALSTLLFSPNTADAQAVKIHQGPAFKSGICEPSIAINPSDPKHVVAGSILNNFYESTDGGKNWSQQQIESSFGVWGDPCLIIDTTGRVYYFHLSDPEGTNWRSDQILDRMVCQTKNGPGGSFSDGSFTEINGKKHDKEWAAVQPRTGAIGLSWTQFDTYGTADTTCKSTILYSESTDQGISWSPPVVITEQRGDCIDDDNTAEGAVPAFGIGNARYVGWALNGKIMFSRSLDAVHWEETTVATQHAGWTQSYAGFSRCNGMPVTVVDHCKQSPYYGRIYLCWGDQIEGLGGEIFVSYSDNAGFNWSAPSSISPQGGTSDQFLPWLTVDPTSGYLYAVFYDRRNTTKDNETNTYLSISRDGGTTWSEQRINSEAFYPSDAVFMGDYNHISAHGGEVRPIWTELANMKKSVWTYLYHETTPQHN